MSAVRSLPIRLAPIAGEGLDSWLEALAHRTATAFGDLLAAVGLNPYHGTATNGWIVALAPEQASTITAATDVSPDVLTTMTLAHYAGRAVNIHPETPTLKRSFPWGNGLGLRYCPACLTDTGGRWQLSWRLGWSFACTTHHRLLVDTCPRCGAVPRRRTHVGDLIPNIGCCARPAPHATGRTPARCDADLTAADAAVLGPDHPAIRAQRTVNTILDHPTAAMGVYRHLPQPRINVLADIRAVAGRALSYGTAQDLARIVPADLLAAYHRARSNSDPRADIAPTPTKPGLAAPAQAATAAVGVLAALHALDVDSVAAGGDALRWLVSTSRQRGLQVSATNIGWGKNTTAVLSGIQLAALGPLLKPSDQLRYRIGSVLPGYPTASAAPPFPPARLPTMLWPAWSLRLAIPHCHQWQLRPALSAVLLLVNSRFTLDEATRLIGSPLEGQDISRVLRLLEKHDQWHNIRAALIGMAAYLADNDIPIDYQRRRRTDYTTLLPDAVWAQICRDTATPGPGAARARIARCFLFERLSGLPAATAPGALDDSAFRTKTADFPRYLTPALAHALQDHAEEFLAERGIKGEPATWQPTSRFLEELKLPGPDPAAVAMPELHRLIGMNNLKLGAAAARLNTTLDTLRHLLGSHPAPRPDPEPGTPLPTPCNRAYVKAKAALSRERLAELYERDRLSLHDIAAVIGVSRSTIASLARDYGLPIRNPGGRPRTTIDRDWLYDQYVNNRRALPDIAAEAAMSTTTLANWARFHAIPLRARGGASHSATLAAEHAAAAAPALIRPALRGIGGRERLERFAAAADFPNLSIAATELGVHSSTLFTQINRLEKDLNVTLFTRAERGHRMQLTAEGSQVVATIRACRGVGWPSA